MSMTLGPDEERRQPSEPTFADVMNGFSFDAGRASRNRRWGRRRDSDAEPITDDRPDTAADDDEQPAALALPAQLTTVPNPEEAGQQFEHEAGATAVRPYAWTRGRTKSGLDLAIETLVSTSQRGRDQLGLLQMEHRAVAELCGQTRSVAEVAALLQVPIGVARVLLGDMAGLGVVTVHRNASSAGNVADLALMERVLSGLRRL